MNPPVDPFVITPREWQKYQEQFASLKPQGGFVTGAQAKNFFLQSQLPPNVLGQIWSMADADCDGKLDINEFSIACKLINLKLRSIEIPKTLPPSISNSLRDLKIQTAVPGVAAHAVTTAVPAPVAPTVAPVAANLPGAVPAIPGILPGSLPGVLPQAIVPPMPAAAAMPLTAGAGGMMPAAAVAGMPLAGGVMPGGMPVGTIAPAGIPNAMPLVGGVVPGMSPAVPAAAGVPTTIIPGIPAPIPTQIPIVAAPPPSIVAVEPKVPATPTPPQSNPPSRHMSISERAPSIESPQGDWIVKAPEKRKYTQVFNSADRSRSGFLTGVQARGILVQSKLPQKILAEIWTLADIDQDGKLSCDEFILAMVLCEKAMKKEPLPTALPPDWIPPSYRNVIKSRQGSVSGAGSRIGSATSSRHASVSSQGGAMDADPLAGLPQTSFEDKRKENFDKGQAELDRRRKRLQDEQRKEKEERERKEREEAEKREKARLEAERKQQEELERQLQKQRELEQEREEQRKRELEAKEAARKELEKQRQLEMEQARIAEMNTQKEREQERVLKLKAQNTQLNIELSTINEKIKELSQKICDTRASVTNVKSVIDGMRSTRDTCMSEMSQNKARIKEQNAKLLQLSQERAKVDAKARAADASNAANRQLIITQLKDKVENSKKEIESKKDDIKSNDVQVAEIKAELSSIVSECEKLYLEYDTQRTQVLELKYNKKNDNVTSSIASSAWDTAGPATTAWGAASSIDQYQLSNDISAAPAAAAVSAALAVDTTGPAPEGFVKYRAIYEFSARNEDEITFVPGDIILVPLEQNAEPGWLAGEINGHTGWFPETYVEKIEDDYAAAAAAAATDVAAATIPAAVSAPLADAYNDNSQDITATTAAAAVAYNGDVVEYYIATYPYQSTEAGDLNFNAGEMVMVIKKEGEWWTGTIGDRTGMFPSNYVQKADIGNTAVAVAAAAATAEAEDNTFNGNAQITTTAYETALEKDTTPQALNTTTTTTSVTATAAATTPNTNANNINAAAAAVSNITTDETRTNEELDTEVSQIYTQSKSQTDPAESYSRPGSRSSTMTPGMRAKRSEIAQVIAPYEATSPEQLSLTRGQLVMIRKKTDTGWWEGELQQKGRRRQIGWFPATYVKVLQGGRNSGRNTPVSGSRIEMTEQILDKVIAMYPYKAQNDDELSFDKDDIISVLGRDEPEWWRGELNGLTGLFPSNYVSAFVTSGNI